jgi:hypothetical protein
LRKLELRANLLSSFPDVAGHGQSLVYLGLQENRFEVLPRLPKLGKTIDIIRLTINPTIEAPPEFFADFPAASKITVQGKLFQTLPNLCRVPLSRGVLIVISGTSNGLRCDLHSRWLLLGFRSAALQTDLAPCRYPEGLRGKPVADFTAANLLEEQGLYSCLQLRSDVFLCPSCLLPMPRDISSTAQIN